jgi:hypothetical protein
LIISDRVSLKELGYLKKPTRISVRVSVKDLRMYAPLQMNLTPGPSSYQLIHWNFEKPKLACSLEFE